jgi:hypothetical protein
MGSDQGSAKKQRLAAMFLLALTVANVRGALQAVPLLRQGYQDFTAFYCGGEIVRRGETARLYDLGLQGKIQREFAPEVSIRQAALPYNHPPFEALLFAPLTHLSYFPAYLVWTALGTTMLAAAMACLRRTYKDAGELNGAFLLLAALGFAPFMLTLTLGQDSVLLMFLATVALILMEQERDVTAGAVLAACLFKFQFAIPLAVVMAARRPRVLLGFCAGAVVLAGVSAAMVGGNELVDNAGWLLHLEKSGAGGAIPAERMVSLHGLAAVLTGGAGHGTAAAGITVLASLAIVAAAMWVARQVREFRWAFAVAVVTALVVSYHALAQDLTVLLPVVAMLFAARAPRGRGETWGDTSLLVALYAVCWAAARVLWLNPLWVIPVLSWIWWKRRSGDSVEAVA